MCCQIPKVGYIVNIAPPLSSTKKNLILISSREISEQLSLFLLLLFFPFPTFFSLQLLKLFSFFFARIFLLNKAAAFSVVWGLDTPALAPNHANLRQESQRSEHEAIQIINTQGPLGCCCRHCWRMGGWVSGWGLWGETKGSFACSVRLPSIWLASAALLPGICPHQVSQASSEVSDNNGRYTASCIQKGVFILIKNKNKYMRHVHQWNQLCQYGCGSI